MRKSGWYIFSRLGALLLLLFFLLLINLPNLIELDNYRPQLLSFLRAKLAGEVNVGKISLTFRQGPGIRIDNVLIVDRSGRQKLAAEQLILNLKLLPLFHQRLQIAGLTLVEPRVELRLEAFRPLTAGFLKNTENVESGAPGSSVGMAAVPAGDSAIENSVSSSAGVPVVSGCDLGGGWLLDEQVRDAELEIVDGSVVFTDCCYTTSPVTTHLEDLDLHIKWHNTAVPVQFSLHTRVVDPAGEGSLQIEGILSNLKLPLDPARIILDCRILADNLNGGAYFPYYQKYVPISFIGARVDIDSTYQGSLMGLFHSRGKIVLRQVEFDYPEVFGHKITADSFVVECDFRLADHYNTIAIRDCKIDFGVLQLQGYCLLDRVRSGIDGRIDLACQTSGFDPAKLVPMLPSALLPEVCNRVLGELRPGGSGSFDHCRLKSSYRQLVDLCVRGKADSGGLLNIGLNVQDLKFTLPGMTSLPIGLKGQISYTGDGCNFSKVDFSWGAGLQGRGFAGSVKDPVGQAWLQSSGRLEARLPVLQRQLQFPEPAYHRPGKKVAEGGAFAFLAGEVRGELALQGPLLEPEKVTLGGLFRVAQANFSLPRLKLPVKQFSGELHLVKQALLLKQGHGRLGSLGFSAVGRLQLSPGLLTGDRRRLQLPFSCRLQSDDFSPEKISELLPADSGLVFRGRAAASSTVALSLRGDLAKPAIDLGTSRLDVDWQDFSPAPGWPVFDVFQCRARLGADKSIAIEHLLLKRRASDLTFSGILARRGDDVSVRGRIAAGHLEPGAFIPRGQGLQKWQWPAGLRVELEGHIDELLISSGAGAAGLTGQFSSWRKFRQCRFRLVADHDRGLEIKQCAWLWGRQKSRFGLSGQLRLESLPTVFDGNLKLDIQDLKLDELLHSPKVEVTTEEEDSGEEWSGESQTNRRVKVFDNLSEVVENDQVRKLMSWKSRIAAQNLDFAINVEHLLWREMVLNHLAGKFSCNSDGLAIDEVTARAFDGEFFLAGNWAFDGDLFDFDLDCDEVNFERFNDYLKNPSRGLPMQGGHGSMSLALDWQGRNLEEWKRHLDGLLDFRFYDGRMKRFTLISNICSLLNVSQLATLHLPKFSRGVPYRSLIGQVTIVNGDMEVDDFALRGPGINLLASGNIDLLNEYIDLQIGVQPLQTVDKMLASIPVVGYIMTGKKKTFIVVPVSAKGHFDNVKITTAAVKGLGRKTVDMLKRLFSAPVHWWGGGAPTSK